MFKSLRIIFFSLKVSIGRRILTARSMRNLKIGNKVKWERPFNLRGKGKLVIGNEVLILKNVFVTTSNEIKIGNTK